MTAASKVSQNGWVRLAEMRSSSNPSKSYVLAIRALKTGETEFGCDCPSRKFRRGTKAHEEFGCTCKHIRAFLDDAYAADDCDLTAEGAEWVLERRSVKLAAQKAVNNEVIAKARAEVKAKAAA